MIKDSREEDLQTKQEVGTNDHTKHPTSSRLWSTLRNPRIVRVSRAFGGKDRHSKVSTIRGLRDRRVRLSIPTAIQLYDLQDKLGLNQPSKVVDWLLNAAQHEIDKLPPLPLIPLIPGNFIQFPQIGAKNDEENLNRAQAFSIADPMLLGNNSVADISLFPKATLNSYTSYHQIEPYVFSSYLTSPNPFQTPPSTFAQLLPWNYSSNINLKQYIHQDEAQQVEGMRGSSAIYKDSGGAHGSNAADFF